MHIYRGHPAIVRMIEIRFGWNVVVSHLSHWLRLGRGIVRNRSGGGSLIAIAANSNAHGADVDHGWVEVCDLS